MTETVCNLALRYFRNHERKDVSFSPQCNIIVGPNGAGKSNIIEALQYISSLRSYRQSSEQEMTGWGRDGFFCAVETSAGNRYEAGYSGGQKKTVINGNTVKRFADYYGRFNSIVFSPDDVILINGTPEIRRRYVDSVIAKYDREYLQDLVQFKKVLKQRNMYFRKRMKTRDLEVWDVMCAGLMKKISAARKNFVSVLTPFFRDSFQRFSGFGFAPHIDYVSRVCDLAEEDVLKLLAETQPEWFRRGFSVCGVHRDDYQLTDGEGHLLADSASQGQKKMAALALKYAEFMFAENIKRISPVLLLDDVFSELDGAGPVIFHR
jgi:DNA replication and repair protein RecF